MKIKEYISIIDKTKVYPKDVNDFGKAYCFLGLLEEFQELSSVPVVTDAEHKAITKEAGDCIWYATAMALENDLNVKNILDVKSTYIPKSARFMDISSMLKKYYRDGKPIIKSEMESALKDYVSDIKHVIERRGVQFSTVLKTNYDKLIKRRLTGTIHGDGDNREEI